MSNLGQAVLDIVGLAASFYTGNPIWFELAVAGGQILFPAKGPSGPQLADTRTTQVTVGAPIPIVFGTTAVGGTVMYLGSKINVVQSNTGKSGGKKGGVTTYAYYQSIGVLLCEGPIVDVTRIWENGQLVYDKRTQQPLETGAEYAARLTANATYVTNTNFVLYYGTSTQGQDPTIVADLGIGNVPAFRNTAYIMYPNRQLLPDQGMRHPQSWKFEVVTSGTVTQSALKPTYLASHTSVQTNMIAVDWSTLRYYAWDASGSTPCVLAFDVMSNTEIAENSTTGASGLGGEGLAVVPGGPVYFTYFASLSAAVVVQLDPVTLAQIGIPVSYPANCVDWQSYATCTYASTTLVATVGVLQNVNIIGSSHIYAIAGTMPVIASLGVPDAFGNAVFYIVNCNGGVINIYSLKVGSSGEAEGLESSVTAAHVNALWSGLASVGDLVVNPSDGHLLMRVTGSGTAQYALIKVDPATGLVDWSTPLLTPANQNYGVGQSVIQNGQWMLQDNVGTTNYFSVDTTSGAVTSVPLAPLIGTALPGISAAPTNAAAGVIITSTSPAFGGVQGFDVLLLAQQTGQVTLASIIEAICLRTGLLTSGMIDVSEVTPTVWGYGIARPMSARDALFPCLQVGMLDAVPSTSTIRFQPRGGAAVATLLPGDLGVFEPSGGSKEQPPETSESTQLESEMPRLVRVHYVAPSRDYNPGEQLSPARLGTTTVLDQDVNLAFTLVDSQAAQVADNLWKDTWASRTKDSIVVDWSWGALEVADPVIVPIAGRNQRKRIVNSEDVGFALRKLNLVSDNAGSYTSAAVASVPQYSGQTLAPVPPTALILMDSVLVRDADDTGRATAPIYTAVAPIGTGARWVGAQTLDSPDGITYTPVTTITSQAAYGTALSALGPPPAFFLTDTVNTLTVHMAPGSQAPTSITNLQMLNGGNEAALIDPGPDGAVEIIQFQNVTVNSDGTLTLSGFLRGVRGSEEMASAHVVGSQFVMLNARAGLGVDDLALGRLNQLDYWKAIGNGYTLAAVAPVQLTPIGRSLMPRAPWNVTVAPTSGDTSAALSINWFRRTRVGGDEWTDGNTEVVPLAEDTEAYSIDIKSAPAGTVLRTLSWLGPPPATYSNGDVVADFDDIPARLTLEIYQLSGEVGRGFGHEFTVDVTGVPVAGSGGGAGNGASGAPLPPTGLTATLTSSNVPYVTWNAAVAGAFPVAGYELWASYNGSDFALVARATALSYTDAAVVAGVTAAYEVRAFDASSTYSGFSSSASVTTAVVGTPLRITTLALPNGIVSVAYSTTMAATGGTPPYTWALVAGPDWISLSSGGVLSGTPPTAGVVGTEITVSVTDSAGPPATVQQTYTLTVNAAGLLFLGASMQGLSLGSIIPSGNNNAWQRLIGTDSVYGDTLPLAPASLFGGVSTYTDGIQLIGASGAMTNAIATDGTVPAGVSNKVLVMTFVNPYTSAMQNSYLTFPDQSKPQGMVYTSRWLWLQADLPTRGSFWMEITESKTPNPCERFQVGINQYSWTGFNQPVFTCLHDVIGLPTVPIQAVYFEQWLDPNGTNGPSNHGLGQTHKAPVPLGRWFRVEFAFNRRDASGQGWMWFALTDPGSSDSALQNGVTVFALRGSCNFFDANANVMRTLGMNEVQPSALINRLFMISGYSNMSRSSGSPFVQKCTDIQVYTGWPSTATAHPTSFN